jgi:t-SNARE complex subunit (syntaxin)
VVQTAAAVAQVHAVFSELHALVGAQQAHVDDVEAHVDRAADGTAQGLKQLRAANRAAVQHNACWVYGGGCSLLSVAVLALYLLWPNLSGAERR